jgi:hypothetical protein
MNIKQTLASMVKHALFIPVLLGVALRVVLMPFFIWPADIVAQIFSIQSILNHYDPYSLSVSMYPPFIYMFFYPILLIASRAGLVFKFCVFPVTFKAAMFTEMITPIFGDPTFLVFWKIPLLVFDLLTGLLVYGLTKELTQDPSKARKGFILWFFNPFVLITSYVHGAFDVIAVFFILLGIYLLLKSKYLLSGISFGFGGITKISPFLIAIPLSFLVFFEKADGSSGIFSRKRWLHLITILVGCTIPILISILWDINYYNLLIASTLNELSIGGGLNQWFFAINDNLRFSLLTPNLNVVKEIFYLYPLISLIPLLSLRKTLWNSKINSYAVLLLSALSLIMVYFVSPASVAPQYVLWLVPILTVISMKNRRFYLPLAILSLAASAFFFSLETPFAFMYPLALFTPLYDVHQLNTTIIDYAKKTGVFCPFLQQDLCFVFGAVGFFGLVLSVLFIAKELRRVAKDAQN